MSAPLSPHLVNMSAPRSPHSANICPVRTTTTYRSPKTASENCLTTNSETKNYRPKKQKIHDKKCPQNRKYKKCRAKNAPKTVNTKNAEQKIPQIPTIQKILSQKLHEHTRQYERTDHKYCPRYTNNRKLRQNTGNAIARRDIAASRLLRCRIALSAAPRCGGLRVEGF